MQQLFHRIGAWFGAIPAPRLRRILLGLYLLTAAADAGGKLLATSPAFNRAAARLATGRHAENLRIAARPSGNFEIFRLASIHLATGDDMYAEYPDEHSDRFKYSPSFALLFAPFALLWWPLALFLWNSLNALLLFVAVGRILPARAAVLAQGLLLLELLRGMQNAQSNALVAALIVLSFASLERHSSWKAAIAVALGASIKIFPLAALTFAIATRRVVRTGLWTMGAGAALIALPLIVTPASRLLAQYASWRAVESSDAQQRWFSAMELLHRATSAGWPNWPVQIVGTLALLAPLAMRRDRWSDNRFRLLYLCSLLLYVVLFNHQAERASYLIAFVGATIWFTSEPTAAWRWALYAIAFTTIPLMSTLIPGSIWRGQTATLLRLAVPTLVIWVMIQRELMFGQTSEAVRSI